MRRTPFITALQVLILAVVAISVLPAQPALAAATSFFVDPGSGSDSNSGTSKAAAFKTIQRAQAAVRAVTGRLSHSGRTQSAQPTLDDPVRPASGIQAEPGHLVRVEYGQRGVAGDS